MTASRCPSGRSSSARCPTEPRSWTPVALNVNENPYPPSPVAIDDLASELRAAALGLNRYPDRDALALRADLADYLNRNSTDGGGAGEGPTVMRVRQVPGRFSLRTGYGSRTARTR